MKTLKSVVAIVALTWTTVTSYCASPSNTDQLAGLIEKNLSQWYPTQNSNIIRLASEQIASGCASATNSAMLYNALTNAFCSEGLTNSDASAVAATIALQIYNPGVPGPALPTGNVPPPLNLTSLPPFVSTNHISIPAGAQNSLFTNISPSVFESQPSNSFTGPIFGNPESSLLISNSSGNAGGWTNWRISLSSGAEFQNPYNISVPSGEKYGTLTNSGNNTVAYLQFEIMRRGVFAPDPLPDDLTNWWNGFTFCHWFKDANLTPDLQFDVGFLLGNDNNLTTKSYSAQTLAGSDIYLNFAFGFPVWRNNWQSSDKVPVQVSFGYSIGVTTDDAFEQVHDNHFIGGVMDIGIDPKWISNSFTNVGNGLFETKFGEGYLDFPSMTGTENQVNLDGNGSQNLTKNGCRK